MDKTWVLQRGKNHIFEIIYAVMYEKYNSYTKIVLTQIQAQKLLGFANWEKMKDKYVLKYDNDPIKYDQILKRFFEVLKENRLPLEPTPSKILRTDTPGTSKLVRSKDKSRIHIALRMNRKTKKVTDRTYINAVCIDDEHRNWFFRDVKTHNGYPSSNENFALTDKNGQVFKWWSDYMDMEYQRLYELRKTEPKNK